MRLSRHISGLTRELRGVLRMQVQPEVDGEAHPEHEAQPTQRPHRSLIGHTGRPSLFGVGLNKRQPDVRNAMAVLRRRRILLCERHA
ncbi:hypothetical protein THICB1_100111 [Thiomonas arsenitoxydans]|uniref:Uncharacterized protein n=1 Tax=Thiomonas arsenitoxydans (strain DSM 22701 / CIP 110005 / 3As) TaxID=426114 RepID=A0ABM9T3P7_THIA3|nr:hypothetical protein THICB1_100111 [Thiomonas arsenitoxydans]CQR27342.1 hypothetical protein THICB6_110108 [Thiomonas arsenitoxydans]CQR31240.1 hypothetical protein ACO7_230093 [Thiomonas arsenitoxydans]CQR31250.1 hypothetical protein ACO3_250093 [Thiomonas arsenitoxydans]